jgi:DNA-binding transcriptional LysR family regulator
VPTNFRTLDLNLLRVFDVVMSEGNLTRAADVLSITQPAASHALKRLHDAVGETLFTRGARGMTPTARAQALWPQVRGALDSMRHALSPDTFDPQADSASFRIAMADATATLIAPPLVRAIEAGHANVTLRVMPLTTRDPRRLLRDGEADLAIGHFPEAIAALVADGPQARERFFRLHETRYVCVMRRGHPLAEQPLTLDAYCAAHHLLVSFSGRPHGLVDQALAALGRRRRVVLTVNQFFTAGQVVTQSDLLTVLPLSFIPAADTQDRVVTRPLPFPLAPVAVQMLWPVRQDADPAHRWLRTQVQQAAGVADA